MSHQINVLQINILWNQIIKRTYTKVTTLLQKWKSICTTIIWMGQVNEKTIKQPCETHIHNINRMSFTHEKLMQHQFSMSH